MAVGLVGLAGAVAGCATVPRIDPQRPTETERIAIAHLISTINGAASAPAQQDILRAVSTDRSQQLSCPKQTTRIVLEVAWSGVRRQPNTAGVFTVAVRMSSGTVVDIGTVTVTVTGQQARLVPLCVR